MFTEYHPLRPGTRIIYYALLVAAIICMVMMAKDLFSQNKDITANVTMINAWSKLEGSKNNLEEVWVGQFVNNAANYRFEYPINGGEYHDFIDGGKKPVQRMLAGDERSLTGKELVINWWWVIATIALIGTTYPGFWLEKKKRLL